MVTLIVNDNGTEKAFLFSTKDKYMKEVVSFINLNKFLK